MLLTDRNEKQMARLKDRIRRYWNWRSESYGDDADKSETIAAKWESIIGELAIGAGGRQALDIGTGRGQVAVYLARAGFAVTGIDLSENMIDCARQNARRQDLDIDFRTGDAEHLAFDDDAFDVLVSRNLLWTLPRPQRALEEWRRVLRPGGLLVVSDGLWMNTTWKRLHRLAFQVAKGVSLKKRLVSGRFFCSYAFAQRSLPFYEGIGRENAAQLLAQAGFKRIGNYDTACFDTHPYAGSKGRQKIAPSFFIAYGTK